MIVTIEYEVKVSLAPFKFYQYSDEADGKIISDAAVTKIDFGDFTADMAFVRDSNKGIKLVLFPPPDITIKPIEPDAENGT
jgi:hypothetical protein